MRKNYPTDLSDDEWNLIEHRFKSSSRGLKMKYSRREMLDAIFYVLRTGCQWRNLPHDFPPWQTVYASLRNWQAKGIFEKINDEIRRKLRLKLGRKKDPSGAIIDSQTVKTTEKGGLLEDTMEERRLKEESATFWLIRKACYCKHRLQGHI